MMIQPYQVDPKCKQSHMPCQDFVQLTLYIDEIDARIDTQILKTTHHLLFHLLDLEYGENLDIGTPKK